MNERNTDDRLEAARACLLRARQRPGLRDLEAALADLTEAIELASGADDGSELQSLMVAACIKRGAGFAMMGGVAEAFDDFERAMNVDPRRAPAYRARGLALLDLDEPRRAMADFNRAIEINPSCGLAYLHRGRAWLKLDDPHEASSDFSRAVELDPGNADVYLSRGWMWKTQGEDQKAAIDFAKVRKLKAMAREKEGTR